MYVCACARARARVHRYVQVPLASIFPTTAVEELAGRMRHAGFEGVDEVCAIWASDLSQRPIVSGFLKDTALGSKRFMSMPDRFTNTINTVDESGGPGPTVCRPAVINNFVGDLCSFERWWRAWLPFMFDDPLLIPTKKGPASKVPCQLLSKISRAKYPALSEEEERVSLPMQVLCLGLFDCTLVHMMNLLSPTGGWLTIKRRLCDALFVNKQARTLGVLCGPQYAGCDAIFLQEVAANFVPKLSSSALGATHHVLAPAKLDSARDQNSVILLKKATFPNATNIAEVSDTVRAGLEGAGVMDGDILAVTATDAGGREYFVVSFHGDTDGLQSAPVLEAVHATVSRTGGAVKPTLLFGLDANVYEAASGGKTAYYADWVARYETLGLASNWGAKVDPVACRTTYNARTFVQPQLQKAVRLAEFAKGDCNPKDYLLFAAGEFEVLTTVRDNTGEGGSGAPFNETAIPSLLWPSDHSAVLTTLRRIDSAQHRL